MIYSVIDVGSNSIRLLVADVDGQGMVVPLRGELKTTRLGRGINAGRLLPESMENTLAALVDFIRLGEEAGAAGTVLAATSAVRDAANRNDFVEKVQSVTGHRLLVLSGADEARLSYQGVTRGLKNVQKVVVVDIGGGSTEFTWQHNGVLKCVSVKAGAVRMSEGGYGSGQIRKVIGEAVRSVKQDRFDEVVAVGGTATTLAAVSLGLRKYDPRRVHGFRLARDAVHRLDQKLHRLSLQERKTLPGLQPERADIIPAGVRILHRILQGLGAGSTLVSEADILYGLAVEASKLSKLNCNKIPK